MKTYFAGILASLLLANLSLACDYNFHGIETDEGSDYYFMVQRFIDKEGKPRTLKRVGIPLNAEVKQAFINAIEQKTELCAYGTSSPVSPRVFYIYGTGNREQGNP